MKSCIVRTALRLLLLSAVAAGPLLLSPRDALGEETTPTVVRVEEDWELLVTTPDGDSNSPQISCVVSPVGNVESLHAVFELNHQSQPSYQGGGMQLQVWDDETLVESRNFPTDESMDSADETVSWTQTMEANEGHVTFEVVNGHSTTWGEFGGQGYLNYSAASSLSNLNGYSPDVSVANSSVGFAGNRVKHLTLVRVRYVLATGEVYEDSTVRVAHAQE
jgi:hypothetical protein